MLQAGKAPVTKPIDNDDRVPKSIRRGYAGRVDYLGLVWPGRCQPAEAVGLDSVTGLRFDGLDLRWNVFPFIPFISIVPCFCPMGSLLRRIKSRSILLLQNR